MLPDEETPRRQPGDLLAMAVLFLAVVALFLPSLPYQILGWDDEKYLVNNAWLLNPSMANVRGIFTHFYFSNYHPLTMLSYMMDFHLWGGHDPAGYRVGNIVLHAATVVAAFVLMRTVGAGTRVAFFLTLLFGVHPLRLESVVWLSERKDVLAGLFYVLALVAWRLASRPDGRQRWLAVAVGCFVLSLLSKAMAVSLPLVLILHDVLLAPARLKKRWWLYPILVVLMAIFIVANIKAQSNAVSVAVPLTTRLAVALWSPVHYSLTTIFPLWISPLYPYEMRPSQYPLGVLAGILACAMGLGAVIWAWKRRPVLAWGLLSSAIVLGPVSGVVAFGTAYAADRYSYLPTILLFAGLAPFLGHLLTKKSAAVRGAVGFAAGAAGLAMAGLTLMLMPMWATTETLWDRVLEIYPQSTQAETNKLFQTKETTAGVAERAVQLAKEKGLQASGELAVLRLMGAKRFTEALAAADLIPNKSQVAYWRMRVERERGDLEEAAEEARRVIAFGAGASAEHRANAAYSLIVVGQLAEGRTALEEIGEPTMAGYLAWSELAARTAGAREREEFARNSLDIFPAEPRAILQLGETLMRSNRLAEGHRYFRKAARHPLATDSTRGYAWAMLGREAEIDGRRATASSWYEKAFYPDLSGSESVDRAVTLAFLGYTAEQIGQLTRAEELYQESLKADPTNADAASGLAFMLIQRGRQTEARKVLEEAALHHPEDASIRHNLEQLRKGS